MHYLTLHQLIKPQEIKNLHHGKKKVAGQRD